MDFQALRSRLVDAWRRALDQEPVPAVGALLAMLCLGFVGFAALFPLGGDSDMGTWKPVIDDTTAQRVIEVVYKDGGLELQLDPNESGELDSAERRFVGTHLRKFNRHVRGRVFRAEGLVQGPPDCLFSVQLNRTHEGGLAAGLVSRDLSAYDMFPSGERRLKDLGAVYYAPSAVRQPYFSDGSLGFFLDPRPRPDGGSLKVALTDEGIWNANTVILTDRGGIPRAQVRPNADGSAVEVKPLGGYAVYLENNPPMSGDGVLVGEGQVVEIGGRFFEAHFGDAATLAITRQKADGLKRIYPTGKLFHIVGPLALDGAHQSLGIEYLFQEYLMGVPSQGLPPGELWLTLDERLQANLGQAITELSGQSLKGTASALIMNAQTGAVVAMAASPGGYDPEDRGGVMDLLAAGKEPYFNHGCFKRHVIGSVTKSFYAFMALQIMGDKVLDMRLDLDGAETRELFGHRLYGGSAGRLKFHSDSPTFESYLIQSDNAYQHSLGLLLLAGVTDPGRELPAPWAYAYGDDLVVHPLAGGEGDWLKVANLGPARDRLWVDPSGQFSTLLQSLFDLSTESGKSVANDRDLSVYSEDFLDLASRVLQARQPSIEKPRDILLTRSVVCAPESPRMELTELKNTKDASNVLYGANRNRWTDVKLCEAFSRMVTGKRVRARLVSRYKDSFTKELVDLEAKAAPEPLPLPNPRAPEQLRRILERVPRYGDGRYPDGTAHLLQPTIDAIAAKQPGFTLLGKTGTIDDGLKGEPDSRLFLGSFGVTDAKGFKQAYTFVIYLRNAVDPDAPFHVINQNLPEWWRLLTEKPPTPPTQPVQKAK